MNERRIGADFLTSLLSYFSIAGWLFILVASILIYISQPEMSAGLVRYKGIAIREYWLKDWLIAGLVVTLLSSVLSIVAFAIHKKRSRRKSDRPGFMILMLAILSISFVILVIGVLIE